VIHAFLTVRLKGVDARDKPGHDAERKQMPPRIRSLLSRPPYTRDTKTPGAKAPTVFREFVETLQRLDPPATERTSERRRYGNRPRKQLGNGHARPRRGRARG
jgi:hypothetical protein